MKYVLSPHINYTYVATYIDHMILIFCACIHITGIHAIITTALTYVCIISHQLNKNGKGLPLVRFKIFLHKLENHQIQLKSHRPLAKMCP